MAIPVIQFGEHVTPGRLGVTLRDHGFKLDVRRVDVLGASGVPRDLDDVHGLVVLGGEQNVGESHPWVEPLLSLIRAAHAAELPVIGVCLGHQLVAHALGGKVEKMERPEWGFHDVALTVPAQTETMMAGIAWNSPQFEAHGYEVTALPTDSVLLASSKRCKNQAFRAGLRTFGFQYHFECDRAMIDTFAAGSADSIRAAGLTPQDVQAQAAKHYEMFARLADRLCVNLATFLFPLELRMTA